ncbi:hypothetical protein jhhlp_002792 [Lomentospora prolificans]|uniref:Uncharacterized protein n=1 Tax=Lomentospora prolificans TaxID=41688 RepID=A0A2N3NF87_9PEZI|nr:hypothetical protein jhhlp_002792 [Lomentospora prolificans]
MAQNGEPNPLRPAKGLNSSRWASSSSIATTSTVASTIITGSSATLHPGKFTPAVNPIVPRTPERPPSNASAETHHSYEMQRFEKIAKRLSWKLLHLSSGFSRASEPHLNPVQRAEYETMFKLDFYEFYMLLERALVHLLGIFDIVVTRDPISSNGSGPMLRDGAHAYHHNVLAALDAPDNELHQVLGKGEVRRCLAKAKEMRNRWKYLDDSAAGGKSELALKEYDVERVLETILDAFQHAYEIAKQRVVNETGDKKVDVVDWSFMVDAMDWEAV